MAADSMTEIAVPIPELGHIERQILLQISFYLDSEYGIYYAKDKLYSLYLKINRRIKVLGLRHIGQYARRLRKIPEESRYFLDAVTINKTDFFRERGHWDFIEKVLFPQWKQRMARGENIKVWSAAASTGAEAYSMGMFLDDLCSRRRLSKRFRVLASDISNEALQTAIAGRYSPEVLNHIRKLGFEEYIDRYFTRDEDSLSVCPLIREYVTFRTFNLNSNTAPFSETFDLVMCCNVMIYFQEHTIARVVRMIERSLKPGAYLFIGHTENLLQIDHSLQRICPAIFRKPE